MASVFEVRFYSDRRGREPVLGYLLEARRSGDVAAAAAFERVVDRLIEAGTALSSGYSRIVDRRARIYELRFGPHRAAYVEHGGEFVLLHAWRKRSQKLDVTELEVARRRALDWAARNG